MTDLDQAIRDSLANLVANAGPSPTLDDLTAATPRPDLGTPRKPTPWLLATAVAVLVALAGALVWVGSADDNQDVITDNVNSTSTTATTTVPTPKATAVETTVGPTTTDPTDESSGDVPLSWLAITDTGSLVDVDTATGESTVIDELDPDSDTTLDRAYRQPGTDVIWATAIGDPARGTVVRRDQAPLADSWFSFGVAVTPSPDGQFVAMASFAGLAVATTAELDQPVTVSDAEALGNNSISWLPASHGLVWTYHDPESSTGFILEIVEFSDGLAGPERRQTKLPPDLAGVVTVAVREDDAIVVAGCTTAVFEDCGQSRVVVLDGATLEVVDELDLAPGARLGGYDPTGRFLIYTDRNQTVHWHSDSGSGVLGTGYTWASW